MNQEYLERLNGYMNVNAHLEEEDKLEPAEMLRFRNAYEFFQGDLSTEDPIRNMVSQLSLVLVTIYAEKSKKSQEKLREGISLLEEATKSQEQSR